MTDNVAHASCTDTHKEPTLVENKEKICKTTDDGSDKSLRKKKANFIKNKKFRTSLSEGLTKIITKKKPPPAKQGSAIEPTSPRIYDTAEVVENYEVKAPFKRVNPPRSFAFKVEQLGLTSDLMETLRKVESISARGSPNNSVEAVGDGENNTEDNRVSGYQTVAPHPSTPDQQKYIEFDSPIEKNIISSSPFPGIPLHTTQNQAYLEKEEGCEEFFLPLQNSQTSKQGVRRLTVNLKNHIIAFTPRSNSNNNSPIASPHPPDSLPSQRYQEIDLPFSDREIQNDIIPTENVTFDWANETHIIEFLKFAFFHLSESDQLNDKSFFKITSYLRPSKIQMIRNQITNFMIEEKKVVFSEKIFSEHNLSTKEIFCIVLDLIKRNFNFKTTKNLNDFLFLEKEFKQFVNFRIFNLTKTKISLFFLCNLHSALHKLPNLSRFILTEILQFCYSVSGRASYAQATRYDMPNILSRIFSPLLFQAPENTSLQIFEFMVEHHPDFLKINSKINYFYEEQMLELAWIGENIVYEAATAVAAATVPIIRSCSFKFVVLKLLDFNYGEKNFEFLVLTCHSYFVDAETLLRVLIKLLYEYSNFKEFGVGADANQQDYYNIPMFKRFRSKILEFLKIWIGAVGTGYLEYIEDPTKIKGFCTTLKELLLAWVDDSSEQINPEEKHAANEINSKLHMLISVCPDKNDKNVESPQTPELDNPTKPGLIFRNTADDKIQQLTSAEARSVLKQTTEVSSKKIHEKLQKMVPPSRSAPPPPTLVPTNSEINVSADAEFKLEDVRFQENENDEMKNNEEEEEEEEDDDRPVARIAPPVYLVENPLTRFILSHSPVHIANQLSLIEHSLFARIPLVELVHGNCTKADKSPYFSAHIEFSNQLANWIITSILTSQIPAERATRITFWIQIAKYSTLLNNWNGAVTTINSLSTTAIERLKKSWEKVPKPQVKKFLKIKRWINPEKNFLKLRKKMILFETGDTGGLDSEEGERLAVGGYVPYLALVSKDLFSIEEGNPNFVPGIGKGKEFVNLGKCRMIMKIVNKVHKYQQMIYLGIAEDIRVKTALSALLAAKDILMDENMQFDVSYHLEPKLIRLKK